MRKHKMIYIISACLFSALMSGSSSARIFYGDFADLITENTRTALIRSYLVMDCCDEWKSFRNLVLSEEGACAAEGLEFYEYNRNGRLLRSKGEITVIFHPTEDFSEKPYDRIEAVSLKSGEHYETEVTPEGDLSARVREDGVFAFIKYREEACGEVWISCLEDCNGECSACSDGW